MLDIGSWEFLIVIVIALIVIGPKDLPGMVRTVSQWIRRARELAREFQGGLEDMAREAELDKVKDSLQAELDPGGMVNTIKRDIEDEIETEWLDDATTFDFEDEERAKGEGIEPETVEAEPSEAEPSEAESSEAEPSEAEPSEAEPSEAEPSEAEPSEAEPSEAEPSEAEPSEAEPSEAGPSETGPSETGESADASSFEGEKEAVAAKSGPGE